METGIPIGNLTSQVFANIYLNELDRYVLHHLKPLAYARYGDDFLIFDSNLEALKLKKEAVKEFLSEKLKLTLHAKNDIIVKASEGIHYLGIVLYPTGRSLNDRAWERSISRVTTRNISSYSGLVNQHSNQKRRKEFMWSSLEFL